jgi:Restriction endonuclease
METYGNASCISTAIMSQEPPESSKARIRAYKKQWAKDNKDKLRARMRAYYLAHQEKLKARTNARYYANKPEIAAKKKAYMKAYAPLHRAQARAYLKQWRKANPEKDRAYVLRSNAKRQARCATSNFNGELLLQKLAYYGAQCLYCGRKSWLQWDHVKPLSKGGANLLCNLVPACAPCNMKKRNIWLGVQEWLRCRDYGVTVLRDTPQPAPHSGNAEKI